MDSKTRRHDITSKSWWAKRGGGWFWLVLLVLLAPTLPAQAAPPPVTTNPPCGPATGPGTPVTTNVILTTDITCTDAPWIQIAADNITVNLNGKIVTCSAPDGYQGSCQEFPDNDDIAIDTNGHKNITIIGSSPGEDKSGGESGVLKGFDVGVAVNGGTKVKVLGVTVTGPHDFSARPSSQGVRVTGVACPPPQPNNGGDKGEVNKPASNDNGDEGHFAVQIAGNNISYQTEGIELSKANCVAVLQNIVHDNSSTPIQCEGIVLEDSAHNVIASNVVFANGENFAIDGGIVVDGAGSTSNLVAGNKVNDNNGDGISLRDSASGNAVVENEMLFNGEANPGVFHDADEKFTAAIESNTWKDNECKTFSTPNPGASACAEDE